MVHVRTLPGKTMAVLKLFRKNAHEKVTNRSAATLYPCTYLRVGPSRFNSNTSFTCSYDHLLVSHVEIQGARYAPVTSLRGFKIARMDSHEATQSPHSIYL